MLKKKTLTETIYNNGDPFQIRKAIDACIGSWQKQEKYQVLWDTLDIGSEWSESTYLVRPESTKVYLISVEAVYDAGN